MNKQDSIGWYVLLIMVIGMIVMVLISCSNCPEQKKVYYSVDCNHPWNAKSSKCIGRKN